MRITKIAVKGLFGMFDHEIPLNQESRITIVHGPNGVGKTVLLQLVHAFFQYDYEYLERISYDQLRVDLSQGGTVLVDRYHRLDESTREQMEAEFAAVVGDIHEDVGGVEGIFNDVILSFSYYDAMGKTHSSYSPMIPFAADDLMKEILQKWRPDLEFVRMHDRAWWVDSNGGVFAKEEMLRQYPPLHLQVYSRRRPDWLASLQQQPLIRLISTRRLLQDDLTWELLAEMESLNQSADKRSHLSIVGPRDAVRELSNDLNLRSEELNFTPEALAKLRRGEVEEISIAIGDVNSKLSELEDEITEIRTQYQEELGLDTLGLFDEIFELMVNVGRDVDALINIGMHDELAKELANLPAYFGLYAQLDGLKEGLADFTNELGWDVEVLMDMGLNAELSEKIANYNLALHVQGRLNDLEDDQFDEQRELELLTKIRDFGLSSLFLDIVNERFLFKSLNRTIDNEVRFIAKDGSEVPFSALSSGEQNFLILYHHLFFHAQPNALVMIDEPELSLNVVWQRRFLADLDRIVELCMIDVLIATHSPMVIHDKWDWVVHLGEKVDD